jgi:hypothetical protein
MTERHSADIEARRKRLFERFVQRRVGAPFESLTSHSLHERTWGLQPMSWMRFRGLDPVIEPLRRPTSKLKRLLVL